MGTARLYAWSRRHPVLVDAMLAAVLFLTVGLLSAVVAGWVGLLFGTLLTLPLAVRRRLPVAVFGSTVAVDGPVYERPVAYPSWIDALQADTAATLPRPTDPEEVIVPPAGSSSPARIFVSVVFPAPLRPTSPIRSPDATRKVASASRRREPARSSMPVAAITTRHTPGCSMTCGQGPAH